MHNGAGISRWQAALSMLVVCGSGLGIAPPAEAGRSRNNRPNVAPVISGTPAAEVSVGEAYYFRASATDADGDRLSFYIRNQPLWASFNPRSGELRGAPTQAGSYPDIVIGVSDRRESVTLPPFTITVTSTSDSGNQPPSIDGSPPPAVAVGQGYAFQPSASDPEHAQLSFSVQNRPSWASFDASTGRLAGTPAPAQIGTYDNIVVSVTDGVALASLEPFDIQVTSAPNGPPVISGAPTTRVVAGQPYSFTPSASDPDGDPLSFSASTRPAWASFDQASGRLSGTPSSSSVGKTTGIVIGVSDGKSSAALPAFDIEVVAAPNREPLISGVPSPSVVAGQAYSFTPTASDPDGDRLSFAIQNRPAWASFDASTGRLSGTPTTQHVGTYSAIALSVTDGQTFSELPAFTIEVTAAPNRAPTITGSPAPTVIAGQPYSFAPAASDADGDPLVFSIQSRPSWASFSTSTGRLSGTPTNTNVGAYSNIVISVSDGRASAALPAFAIEVAAAPNRAPTLSGSPPTSAQAGQPYAFAPLAADADGDALSFSISNKPAWTSFDVATGQLTGTPQANHVGYFQNIVISVSDGRASASLPAFAIRVDPAAMASVTLSWHAPTANEDGTPLTDLAGYQVHYGQAAGQYSQSVSLPSPTLTSVTIEDLAPATWYFAVKAVNSDGVQSSFSNEAAKTLP